VLIVTSGLQREVRSIALRELPDVSLVERGDRSGSVVFGAPSKLLLPESWPGASKHAPPGFDLIANAREVYDRIQDTRQALLGPA
jgi:hypothetical protein